MKFNENQLKAINAYEGAYGVVAGAGSGKSTVLVNRIKNLIKIHNVDENDILAISFTRNTADELRSKLNKMGFNNINIGTFHSICGRILSERGKDVSKIIKKWQIDNCIKAIDRKADVDNIMDFISYQKNYLKSYNDEFISKTSNYYDEDLRVFFKAYEEYKIKNKLYDLEDWMILCYNLLKDDKDYKGYKFVLVDETQDSNSIQDLLVHQWCRTGNIFCVGDYRQSIYSFRGAVPEQFMDFDKQWNNSSIIDLNINYRSCKNIVENSNKFIKQYYGDYRYYSDTISNNEKDGIIITKTYYDRKNEGIEIADKIEQLINNGENPNEIAVLYRMNTHSIYIENELKNRNIPYYISNDSSFFKRTEIVAIMSYLRLINNLTDDGAFENIFNLHNYPIKFFSKNDLNDIEEFASSHDLSLYESFTTMKFNKKWQNDVINDFKNIINNLRLQKDKKVKIDKFIDNIKRAFKLEDFITDKYTNKDEQNERLNAIEILKSFVKGDNLERFIQYVDMTNTKKKPTIDGVKLLTIHASKGLEFKHVFIISIEDGKFPSEKSDILEEARLFYVAITRPKENLYLSQIGDDNRFIKEYIS